MAKSVRTKPLRQQPAFKRLRELLKQAAPRDLIWHYRIGQCVERLFPSEDRQYGKGRMNEIADALNLPAVSPDYLWKHRAFLNAYSRDEVSQLSKRDSSGYQLAWNHLAHLASLDPPERTRFQEKCIRAEWSVQELHRAIMEHRGRRSQGGQPMGRPKTLDAALRQLVDDNAKWIRRHRKVWFNKEDPAISEDSKQQSPKQLPKLLDEAVDSWETMQQLIKQSLPRLRKVGLQFNDVAAACIRSARDAESKQFSCAPMLPLCPESSQ